MGRWFSNATCGTTRRSSTLPYPTASWTTPFAHCPTPASQKRRAGPLIRRQAGDDPPPYQNRAIEAAQVIEELIALAREMREANARSEQLGLSKDELAFYDALETNDSTVQVLGDETLRDIARELVDTVRNNVTIDWTLRENVRASLRRLVRRILRKHGYPPDKQEKATPTVLEQSEVLSQGWATL